MPFSSNILDCIKEFSLIMETNYPELYHFLDEQPITIPRYQHPNINDEILTGYLDNLKRLIQDHEKNQ